MILRQIIKIALQIVPGTDLRYLFIHNRSDSLAPRLVSPGTEIVIDGFPRSANTSIYYAVQAAFPEARIAHHVHSWQQFLLARIYRVPSILIVRHPDACVQSIAIKRGGTPALYYLDYVLTTGLGAVFAHEIYFFDDLVRVNGVDALIYDVADKIGRFPSDFDSVQVQVQVKDLMAKRTDHKNVKTPPFDELSLSSVAISFRRIAVALYIYLKGDRKL